MKFITLLVIAPLIFSCSTSLPDLTIGKLGLKQKTEVKEVCDGIKFYQIKRGESSYNDFYTLSSGILSKSNEIILINKLDSLGFSTRIETAAENGPHGEFLGTIVRVGTFQNLEFAEEAKYKLKQHEINLALRYTAEDGNKTSGPFEISILEIDLNEYKGDIISSLGHNKIQEKEFTSSIVKNHNAIAGVNAGFFAWTKKVGTTGDPAGISIIDGKLVSEATNGRAALIINNNNPKRVYVAHNVRSIITLQINDSIYTINGLNRTPGKILNCGNTTDNGGTIPIHDFVCQNPNEIILFDTVFGEKSDLGRGMEFLLDSKNKIIKINQSRGTLIPKNGSIIQVTGHYVDRLNSLIKIGNRVSIKTEILSDEGPIKLETGVYATNGGPTLIENGMIDLSIRYKEGWETKFLNFKVSEEFVDEKDKAAVNDNNFNNRSGFYHGWVVRRHPRTAIGITKDNKVIIAVVYGRQPKITAGASVTEMGNLMKSLGAFNAFNLDGGGSSMMIVEGKRTGKSSDANGERSVGDALIFVPEEDKKSIKKNVL